MFDVLVIGGGPAGAATAMVCAGAGLRTAVIHATGRERRLPAESMAPAIELLLARLGSDALNQASCGRFRAIITNNMLRPVGGDVGRGTCGHHVDRIRFDNDLRQHARDCGAVLVEGERARAVDSERGRVSAIVLSSGRRIPARWHVDATGRRQWLSRSLGRKPQTLSPPLTAWRGEVEGPTDFCSQDPVFTRDADGCSWIAPLQDGRVVWTRFARRNAYMPRVPPELAAAWSVVPSVGHDVTWRTARRFAGNGYLVAGEAGAAFDPGFGQGVAHAIASGISAAETILQVARAPANEGLAFALFHARWLNHAQDCAARLAQAYGGGHASALLGTAPKLNPAEAQEPRTPFARVSA
jgi:flavin-dependent dehydrogenase